MTSLMARRGTFSDGFEMRYAVEGLLICIMKRKVYLATAAAVAEPTKILEAREAGMLYSHSYVACFRLSR